VNYLELPHNKKLALLREHSLGCEWPDLDHSVWCLHCGKSFTGQSARVYEQGGQMWLECGTKDCDGSPIDWAPYPWWDDNYKGPKPGSPDDEET